MTEVGAETAPVSLMLFTNAACGYCTEFHEDIFPRLLADYVRTGRVRVAVSPFLLRKYEDSADAALAQLCAARQGKGMAMHDLLFRERVGTPAYRAAIDILAIDQEAFTRCTADPASRMVIDARQAVAASLGITLIPSYVINGATFTGLPSYGDIRGQIEEALRASGRSR